MLDTFAKDYLKGLLEDQMSFKEETTQRVIDIDKERQRLDELVKQHKENITDLLKALDKLEDSNG